MQILPFLLTQLPQFVLNLTSPTATTEAGMAQVTGTAGTANLEGVKTYTLPELPYAYDALEPYMSREILTLHHTKHHAAYISTLNAALTAHHAAVSTANITAQLALQDTIKFSAGGNINHSLFWTNLAPPGTAAADIAAAPRLAEEIGRRWGNVEAFKGVFGGVLGGVRGSGWGWLVWTGRGLEVVVTKDQDPVLDAVPLLGVDMWEHAYYLQYYNDKAAYIKGIWNIVNWEECERRFLAGKETV